MSLVNESFTRSRLDLFCVIAEVSSVDKLAIYPSLISFFFCHQYLFLLLFYRIAMSWLSYSVSAWSLGQHVCRFSPAIAHLSSFWGFGNLQNHPVSLKIYASLLIANSKSVLNIKSRRRPTSLHLKRRPYKVVLRGIHAKHSASSLKVFICNFCLPSNASLSWLGTSFFARVRHLWIRCIHHKTRTFSQLFHSRKKHLLALLGLTCIFNQNNRFPYPFIYTVLQQEKSQPFHLPEA